MSLRSSDIFRDRVFGPVCCDLDTLGGEYDESKQPILVPETSESVSCQLTGASRTTKGVIVRIHSVKQILLQLLAVGFDARLCRHINAASIHGE